ncbi:hypothetical protein OZX72_03050 [Bifidobacterium sp. ESL0769]|uniref:hypothetical protein n=1 Tax=Bifidobacterium sp. ESL0769 TaxID=2983229 RepID=UPI0023FA3570|nr:hypothetical protein [Bifidobacterium sp. ESL0769]WEV67975.1 hypothetical protein OZX72_03050 [Bifidobacterium sp. ESL0769]
MLALVPQVAIPGEVVDGADVGLLAGLVATGPVDAAGLGYGGLGEHAAADADRDVVGVVEQDVAGLRVAVDGQPGPASHGELGGEVAGVVGASRVEAGLLEAVDDQARAVGVAAVPEVLAVVLAVAEVGVAAPVDHALDEQVEVWHMVFLSICG